jgi:hypothetical protein
MRDRDRYRWGFHYTWLEEISDSPTSRRRLDFGGTRWFDREQEAELERSRWASNPELWVREHFIDPWVSDVFRVTTGRNPEAA